MKHLRNVLLVASSAVGQKKTTVRFLIVEADLPKDFVDEFMAANPDINLVRKEEDWTKWMADAIAGNAADLQRMGSGTDIAFYVARGLLYDMTRLMQGGKSVKMNDIDLLGSSIYQYDGKNFGKGKWYGLPKVYNNIGCLTFNKEMFKAAGIAPLSETVPVTYYDELARGYVDQKESLLYHVGMAGLLYYTLPIVVLFFALQRRFISGLLAGGLKG